MSTVAKAVDLSLGCVGPLIAELERGKLSGCVSGGPVAPWTEDQSLQQSDEAMYFLTIKAGNEVLRDRAPFTDYADALAACGEYYEPRAVGAALNFTSIVTGKKFMRSYAQLTRVC